MEIWHPILEPNSYDSINVLIISHRQFLVSGFWRLYALNSGIKWKTILFSILRCIWEKPKMRKKNQKFERKKLPSFVVAVVITPSKRCSRCHIYGRWICVDIHLHGVRHFGAITWYGHFAGLHDWNSVRIGNRNGHRTRKMQTPTNSIRHKRLSRKQMIALIFTTVLNFLKDNYILSICLLCFALI